ncbi:MAG: isopenicillin N synthase family oxygenase [Variovorax sp.]|nr:isopenicillin N synthase family oxygenase [Variovorax sp.]
MSIPMIDLGRNLDCTAPLARQTATELYQALSTIGFAYIRGHTVSAQTREAAFAASREFHASPLEKKNLLAINAAHRGYMPLESNTIVTSSIARVSRPNLSESLMLMHELPADDPGLLAGLPMQGPNQWPDWIPDFKPRVQQYIAEVDAVARYIVQLVAMSLDLPAHALDPYFEKPTTFLRMLHYPPQAPDDQANFGSAPHTDYGFVTLLAQDDSGGLQVRPRVGEWIDAPPIEDAFVLNVADMLSRWTNGRFMSTPHRVINRSGKDRYALPYFLDTSMDAVIECLPTCVDAEHPAKYPPMRYGDRLMEHMSKNYDYRKSPAAAPGAAQAVQA